MTDKKFHAPSVDEVMAMEIPQAQGPSHKFTLEYVPKKFHSAKTIHNKLQELMLNVQDKGSDIKVVSRYLQHYAKQQDPSLDFPAGASKRLLTMRAAETPEDVARYVKIYVRALAGDNRDIAETILNELDGMVVSSTKPPAKRTADSHDGEYVIHQGVQTNLPIIDREPLDVSDSISFLEKVTGQSLEELTADEEPDNTITDQTARTQRIAQAKTRHV